MRLQSSVVNVLGLLVGLHLAHPIHLWCFSVTACQGGPGPARPLRNGRAGHRGEGPHGCRPLAASRASAPSRWNKTTSPIWGPCTPANDRSGERCNCGAKFGSFTQYSEVLVCSKDRPSQKTTPRARYVALGCPPSCGVARNISQLSIGISQSPQDMYFLTLKTPNVWRQLVSGRPSASRGMECRRSHSWVE